MLTLTTSDTGTVLGVFLDGKPAGAPDAFLTAHPHLAPNYVEAVVALHVATTAQQIDVLRAQLTSAQNALDQMRARYEPPPAPKNLLVVPLPLPGKKAAPESWLGADHVGITGFVKGHWQGDLLRRTGDNAFALVAEDGLVFPAGERVSSLSELTREQIETDLLALLATL